MSHTQNIEPIVGAWYRSHGQLFEVVATDEDEQVIEIQHADGNLEEMDQEEWTIRARAGSLRTAEPPESAGLATDHEDEHDAAIVQSTMDEVRGLRADALEDLDLFE
ncbi:MAG: DUF6763 family protein [Steroidobacteraceae bacterium]